MGSYGMQLRPLLHLIHDGHILNEEQSALAFNLLMDGKCSDAEMAAFLMGLSLRGESIDELVGGARVIREKAKMLKAPHGTMDCCGTGGDKLGSYNISTATALVAASCGVPIAKHGNRSSSSRSGAADVLEALGVNINASLDKLEKALQTLGFAFLMAPAHHQAMKHVLAVRRELGFRTIFNLLGPLANPAGAKLQLLGVYDRKWLLPLAETLKRLGTQSAWVVCGEDGMDEVTTTGVTYCAQLQAGKITETILKPEDFGLTRSTPHALVGGDSQENASALLDLLKGQRGPYRDIVVANVAAVLLIGSQEHKLGLNSLEQSAQRAQKAIDSGATMDLLERYKSLVC